jgi:trigger factor
VVEDLLQEKLLGWLEENSTVSEKASEKDKPNATDA